MQPFAFNRSVAIISAIERNPHFQSYLEIGVDHFETFQRIFQQGIFCVGVDPLPKGYHPRIVCATSDAFFAALSRGKFCHPNPKDGMRDLSYLPLSYDVIFIDGDHSHYQSLMDLNNAIHTLKPGGVIFMHDAMPPTEKHTSPDLCGGVFQTIAVAAHTPGLKVHVIQEDYGVAIIQIDPEYKGFPNLMDTKHPETPSYAEYKQMIAEGTVKCAPWRVLRSTLTLFGEANESVLQRCES